MKYLPKTTSQIHPTVKGTVADLRCSIKKTRAPLKLKPMARVSDDDGRLSIKIWYIGMDMGNLGTNTYHIGPGERLYSRSFRYWKKMAGRQVDLSKCRSTVPGMIGGPKTIRIAWAHSSVCESGLLGRGHFRDSIHARKVLLRFRRQLRDPRLSYTREARHQVLAHIASAQKAQENIPL